MQVSLISAVGRKRGSWRLKRVALGAALCTPCAKTSCIKYSTVALQKTVTDLQGRRGPTDLQQGGARSPRTAAAVARMSAEEPPRRALHSTPRLVALGCAALALVLLLDKSGIDSATTRPASDALERGTDSATTRPASDKLALCTMVTLDYESPYLLPWLAYHRLIGFDYVMLYLDDPSGTSKAKHPRILKLLAATDWVKVETKCEAHTDAQGTSHMSLIHRCASSARELGVLWVANWDVDEWPAFGAPVVDWPNSSHVDHVGRAPWPKAGLAGVPSLKAHIKRITAQPTTGLVISRFGFSANGHQFPKRHTLEVEAYTTRWGPTQSPGKLLWRLDSLGTPIPRWFTTHEMFFQEATARSAPVRNMDGSPVRAAQTRPVSLSWLNVSGWAATAVGRDGAGPWAETDTRCSSVRLHHHVQRSYAECVAKQRRMAELAERDSTRGDFTWRATDASVCSDWSQPAPDWWTGLNHSANSPPPLQTDHSLSRFGQVIRTAVVQLFTAAGLKASMDQLGARSWQLSSPPRPEPEDAGLEEYIASLFCYTKRSTNAKQFCDGRLSARVKCSWPLITRYRARFEPDKFESCRTTNGTRMIPSQLPTSLRTFQRLLRCVVESHVGTFRQACQCSMSTCRWDRVAYLVDKPSIVMLALCGSLRAASNTTGIGRWG